MSDNRELATIQRIVKLEKHPNADTLDIATIKGWNVIVKQRIHEENDLVVYFEIDSFLPVEEKYEFLRKEGFKSTQNLGDGFRIRTKKLRGIVSQGLILPLSEFELENTALININKNPDNFDNEWIKIEEGTNLTEFLGIQKYEKPIPSNLMGQVKGNFPSFIPKTDQERVQNLTRRDYEAHSHEEFEVTTKLDGSSMTVYFKDEEFGVCSRNYDLDETEDNLYWQVFNKLNMERAAGLSFNVALQGELCGPGVNNNYAQLKEHDFYLFDVYSIDDKRYLSPPERHNIFKYLVEELGVNIKHAPIIATSQLMPNKEQALAMADHQFNGLNAEGVVYKSYTSQFSFKAISNKYLLKHDE